jgi:hypothetical protein
MYLGLGLQVKAPTWVVFSMWMGKVHCSPERPNSKLVPQQKRAILAHGVAKNEGTVGVIQTTLEGKIVTSLQPLQPESQEAPPPSQMKAQVVRPSQVPPKIVLTLESFDPCRLSPLWLV